MQCNAMDDVINLSSNLIWRNNNNNNNNNNINNLNELTWTCGNWIWLSEMLNEMNVWMKWNEMQHSIQFTFNSKNDRKKLLIN